MALAFLFPPSLGRARATARAELLADSLGRRLGEAVRARVADSYADLEARVLGDEVELAWAPPAVCARAEPTALAILTAVRDGSTGYRAAIVSRHDEGELAGKRAAWVDPISTGGYLLAAAELRRRGVVLGSQSFHGTYEAALLAVLAGDADLASIYVHGDDDDATRRALADHIGVRGVQLATVAITAPSPGDGLIVTAAARHHPSLVEAVAPLTDGSRGPTLLLELFEAETLVRAAPHHYRELRQSLDELSVHHD